MYSYLYLYIDIDIQYIYILYIKKKPQRVRVARSGLPSMARTPSPAPPELWCNAKHRACERSGERQRRMSAHLAVSVYPLAAQTALCSAAPSAGCPLSVSAVTALGFCQERRGGEDG